MPRIPPAYHRPLTHALAAQFLLALAAILIPTLDGGQLSKVLLLLLGACFTGFWLGTAFILRRRPKTPTRGDLFWLRYGSLLLPLASVVALMAAGVFVAFLHGDWP